MVRKILVCADGEEDILIWPLTADGGYSVRSAYRMLVDNENYRLPSSSTPNGDGSVWKKIWKVWFLIKLDISCGMLQWILFAHKIELGGLAYPCW